MTELKHLVERHPVVYHMADAGAWESIQRHGLLSARALLDRFEVDPESRRALLSGHRTGDVPIWHPEHGQAVLRNQTPMPPSKLRRVLRHGSEAEWYEVLNERVFFWSTMERLERFLRARSHKHRLHDVITVCTRSIMEAYEERITLSPINSGTVLHVNHMRCSHTFQTLEEYRCTHRSECFAELTVAGAVPNLVEYTVSVDRWLGQERQCNIWKRR